MLTFHHLGIATKSIANELPFYEILGYRKVSDLFSDQAQGICGQFIINPDNGSPMLELLENNGKSGPLDTCLQKGIKIYHMAYSSDRLEQDLEYLTEKGAKIISPLKKGDFFSKVCFMMLKNGQLIEVVELKPEA